MAMSNQPETNAGKRVLIAASVLVLLLGGGTAWYFRPTASELEEVRRLGARLFSPDAKSLSADERKELAKQLREKRKQLSPEQQKQLRAEGQKKFRDKIDNFFKLPKQEQIAELDKLIDGMLEARQRWQQGGGGNGPFGKVGGKTGGRAGNQSDNNPSGAAGQGSAAKGWKSMTAEQKEQRRKDRLDNSTPEFRAQISEWRQMMRNRMQERGLSTGRRW